MPITKYNYDLLKIATILRLLVSVDCIFTEFKLGIKLFLATQFICLYL